MRGGILLVALIGAAGTSPQEALTNALQAHKAGDLTTAITHYETVTATLGEERCPAVVLSNMAAAHLALGDSSAAVRAWRTAIRVAPSHAESYSNLAIALQAPSAPSEQLEQAQRYALTAVALRPSYTKAHHALANVLQALGDDTSAARAWQQAERLAEQQAMGSAEAPRKLLNRLRSLDDAVGSDVQLGGFGAQLLALQPRIVHVHQLLTPAECDDLIQVAEPRLAKSFVTGDATERNSQTAWLPLLSNHSSAIAAGEPLNCLARDAIRYSQCWFAVRSRVSQLLSVEPTELVQMAEDIQVDTDCTVALIHTYRYGLC